MVKIQEHYYKYWTGLIKPKGLDMDHQSLSDTYGKFYVRPLERGYGLTLGNAIRRVLLSSMMGSAVSAVKFGGVVHEFTTIPDVLEDVTDIILNLKQVRFKQDNGEDQFLKIEKKGSGNITAQDIQTTESVHILNPDQHIATLGENAQFSAELLVTFDRGYVQADEKQKNLPVGYIGVDAIHSPIRRVNYAVNSARVGQRTDYDSLVIEVWTDGSIKAVEAIPLGYKILKEQLQVFINFDENIKPVETSKKEKEYQFNENLFRPVEDLELSVRSANCLKNAKIRFIGDLVTKSEQEMLKTKNFGRKSLNEIKDILRPMGFDLGMTIEGWPPKNLGEMTAMGAKKEPKNEDYNLSSVSSSSHSPAEEIHIESVDQAIAPVSVDQAIAPVSVDQTVAPVSEDQAVAPVSEDQAVAPVSEDHSVESSESSDQAVDLKKENTENIKDNDDDFNEEKE